MIRIEKLTDNHNLTSFDCGDVDLNEFLTDDAIPFQEKRIATTYIVIINDRVAAYFSLLNDKVSRTDVSKSAWRKLKKLFAHSKHRSNYPAIKIGRFAVCKDFASQGLGSVIMDAIKQSVNEKITIFSISFSYGRCLYFSYSILFEKWFYEKCYLSKKTIRQERCILIC